MVALVLVYDCALLSRLVMLYLCTVDALIFCRWTVEKMYHWYEKFNHLFFFFFNPFYFLQSKGFQ